MSLLDFDDDPVSCGAEGGGQKVTSGDLFDPFAMPSSTVQQNQTSTAFDDFDPFSAPAQTTQQSDVTVAHDPFASGDTFGIDIKTSNGTGNIEDTYDPFGIGQASDDPFGIGQSSDPFASASKQSTGSNLAVDDPFGLGVTGSADNPFAASGDAKQSDPFGLDTNQTDTTDPFGFTSGTESSAIGTDTHTSESKMADLEPDAQQALEAQFDDLMGDMTEQNALQNGDVTMTTEQTVDGATTVTTVTKTTHMEIVNGEETSQVVDEISQLRTEERNQDLDNESQASDSGQQGDFSGQRGSREMKAMDYMKQRYEEGGRQDLQGRSLRNPKKLERPWGTDDTSSPDRDSKKLKVKIGPGEHDMVAYSALGVDYGKNKFERSGSQDSSGGTRSPRSPSKWDPDPNRPRPPVVNRNTVEKLPPPQVTQNVRKIFESGSIPDEHEVKKTQINLYESEEAGVFESKPIIREGVTRETDTANDMEALETGKTGKIASDWKNISADKVMCERAPIQLAEDEGCILETAPEQRTDVVREADDNVNNILPGRGQAASVRDKFINRQDAPIERAPIDLYDGGDSNPVVIENEPAAPLQEVIYQQQEEEQPNIQHGRIKNMANYFATKTDEPLNKGPVELCREEDGIILENVPIKRDNVIRECDDVNQSVQIERGNASSLKSKWENREEVFESKGFQMDVAMNGPTVLENEPTQRTDVVREDQVIEDVIPGEAGRARKIASRFLNQDESPRAPREQIHIERSEAPSVLENEPIVRTDVVKCDVDYRRDDPVLSAGSTRNKVGYWLNRNDDFEEVPEEEKKLRWQREIEAARSQAGVYENEPEENPEFEYQEEEDAQLPEAHTASMRTRWVSMQEEEERRRQREECPELVRFTPPRELTPPPLRQSETVQSYQTLTLGGATNNTTEAHESYPQQNGYADDYGAMEYNDDNAQTGPVMKSTTKISLRQS